MDNRLQVFWWKVEKVTANEPLDFYCTHTDDMIVHRMCFLPHLRSDQSVSQLNLFDFGHLTKHNHPPADDYPAPYSYSFLHKKRGWQVE